jgi:Bifunctional DNA primase/polymerase, N-terminal/AAA domain/Primase C terminal 1 (PriCT-1)
MDLLTPFLQKALQNAAVGFCVHPLWPRTKRPLTAHGWRDATTDEKQIHDWWTKWPEANVGIACGPSNLCVLDIDHGIADADSFRIWREAVGLPETYTVRTGRRPEFGVQMYYSGAIADVSLWKLNGCEGQIKSLGGYVLAAGSLHPSGESYLVICDAPFADTPNVVRQLHAEKAASGKDAGPITANRNIELTSIAGKLRNAGLSREAMELALLQVNDDRCDPPLDDEEVRHIAASVARYDVPEPVPEVSLGGDALTPLDWRTHYHSFEDMQNAPPAAFLIEGFLQQDAITALAAPVAQRKSLIALNVAHALCTKQPLFDYFEVSKQPARVLYLCPEMGIRSFTERLRKIGLMNHVGKTLFCRTMSAEGTLALSELSAEELNGAVVIIDTAVRYLKGDENSSEHMRAFAEDVFRLMKDGAVSVLLLHHSAKGTKESAELSLENAMRGSGELGAFVASCWATRLQDPAEPYRSASYLKNVKQRDFESKPFEVTSGPDCRLHIVDKPGDHVTLSGRSISDRDGNEAEAVQIISDNPNLSLSKLVAKMAEHGIKRSKSWVGNKRADLLHVGVKTSA